ncbi:class III extradiol dioxygenase subunit B-like domain-containing protein [Streptomyces winkii]|uniref:class III extradiol dioxygenase subunit B-like domain-containing protein n=1 Tax=Streptomyces winkii TaxID=3051178 RepID=UPI0028D154D9|nr:class III extradiol dioxygenase subunit B-like domain-containing protein [Streptomyces sp. DSM 40971]
MLVAAATCPCPPLLVPEVAGGAAHEMDAARAACDEALGGLASARPDRLVVIGPADQAARGTHPQGARGSFRGYGVDLEVSLGKGEPPPDARPLPSSLAVGAWLLARNDWTAAPVEGLGVGEPLSRERCAESGRQLADSAGRVALLVMGDGTNCRTVKAPGYFDERATAFDAEAARALGAADADGLLALDEELAYELNASGRSCWQVLAGAAAGSGTGGGPQLRGWLLYDEAPYGVGYTVASWT